MAINVYIFKDCKAGLEKNKIKWRGLKERPEMILTLLYLREESQGTEKENSFL